MADTMKPKRLGAALGRTGNGTAGPVGPAGVPVRRRWGRVAAGLGAAVVGMWAFAALYMSAGDKDEVLVVGNNIDRYEEVTTSDLETVRVSLEPGADSISASDEDDFIGRAAATDLLAGMILTEDHFLEEDADIVASGEEVVGAELGISDFPASEASPGDEVSIVIGAGTGGSSEGQDPPAVDGRIKVIGSPDENSGDRAVSLIVSDRDSAAVSAASREGRISVNLKAG